MTNTRIGVIVHIQSELIIFIKSLNIEEMLLGGKEMETKVPRRV